MITAIVSALPEEQVGLRHLLSNHEHLAQIPRGLERGLIHEKEVALALAGVGKVSAAMTAAALIERLQVGAIVFTGVAGAIGREVQIGDVVVGQSCLQHDMDARPLFPRFEIPYTGISEFAGDARLVELATLALQAPSSHLPRPPQIHRGLIISGDRFVSSASEVASLREALPRALCVEMEGAAIAQVCAAYGLPFVAVRSISDKADEQAHVDFPRFAREVAGPMAVHLIDGLMRRL